MLKLNNITATSFAFCVFWPSIAQAIGLSYSSVAFVYLFSLICLLIINDLRITINKKLIFLFLFFIFNILFQSNINTSIIVLTLTMFILLQWKITNKQIDIFLNAILFVSTIISMLIIIERLGLSLTYSFNKNYISSSYVQLIGTIIVTHRIFGEKFNILNLTLLLINLFGLLTNYSRGAFIIYLIVVFLYLCHHILFFIRTSKIKKRVLALMGTLIICSPIIFFTFINNSNLDRYYRVFKNFSDGESRVITWLYSIEVIQSIGFLGLGVGGFKEFHKLGHPHNIYLLLMEDFGIFFGASLGVFLTIMFINSIYRLLNSHSILSMLYVALFIRLQFSGVVYFDFMFIFLLYAYFNKNLN